MNKILFVDDDALTLRMYCEGLLRQGFHVHAAADGFRALELLRLSKFDVMVLDLMMPRFSGYDVLKCIRQEPDLAGQAIIILSNAYLTEQDRTSATVGAQRELLKAGCTPAILGRTIKEVLGARQLAHPTTISSSAPQSPDVAPRNGGVATVRESSAPPVLSPHRPAAKPAPFRFDGAHRLGASGGPANGSPSRAAPLTTAPVHPAPSILDPDTTTAATVRQDFLVNAPALWSALHEIFERYKRAETPLERQLHLTDLFRKIRFVTALAGSAGFTSVARLGSPLEALVYRHMDRTDRVSRTMLRTLALGIDFLHVLLEAATRPSPMPDADGLVLVVDDDEVHNRAVITALEQAQLPARSTPSPATAWTWLQSGKFDLVLMDIEMPGMDGFELCHRLRGLPACATTPVIYITLRNDFESRAQALMMGADDFITKPIMPAELALKTLMCLLRSRLPAPSAPRCAPSGVHPFASAVG